MTIIHSALFRPYRFLAGLLLVTCLWALPSSSFAKASDRSDFSISFQGLTTNLSIISTAVMPSELLSIETDALAMARQGTLNQSKKLWLWRAPENPGRYTIEFRKNNDTITLHVFVMTPHENTENATLNGYKIGSYRKTLFRGLSSYAPPKGFVDLSHGPADLNISPNFTLGQFICKQQPGHDPTYLLIRPETLIKLETLLEAANKKGWKAETFHIMSGFRTPFYNRSIGNRTTSSRHLYGGATDIWLDGDGDGLMDDLNGDSKIDKNDARELAKLAESLAAQGGNNWPSGGIGIYGANAAHGPFIHIDSRGYKARWGK